MMKDRMMKLAQGLTAALSAEQMRATLVPATIARYSAMGGALLWLIAALGFVAAAHPIADGAAFATRSRRRHNRYGCQDQELSHNTISIPKGSPRPRRDTRGPHNSTSRCAMCKF